MKKLNAVMFAVLCSILTACGASLQPTMPSTLPPAGSAQAEMVRQTALECFATQDYTSERCRMLETVAVAGNDVSDAARAIRCHLAHDHASERCRALTGEQTPQMASSPAPTAPVAPPQAPAANAHAVAQTPAPAVDPRLAAMQPWAAQLGLQLCSPSQVMPGGPLNSRMVFVNVPYPGAQRILPDMGAQAVHGMGLVTWQIEASAFAYRFVIGGPNGEDMYFFSGVREIDGTYRIMRSGTVIQTSHGRCLSPILPPDGNRYVTFRMPPNTSTYIDVQAFAAPSGDVAVPVSACRFLVDAGTYSSVEGPIMTLRRDWFIPRRVFDGTRWVNQATCGQL